MICRIQNVSIQNKEETKEGHMTKRLLLPLEPVRIAAQQLNITMYVRNVAIIKANLQ
jgi:hypothetical protein